MVKILPCIYTAGSHDIAILRGRGDQKREYDIWHSRELSRWANQLLGTVQVRANSGNSQTISTCKLHYCYILCFALLCNTGHVSNLGVFAPTRHMCKSLCPVSHFRTSARTQIHAIMFASAHWVFFMSCVRPHFDIRAIPPWSSFGLCANGAVALLHILL